MLGGSLFVGRLLDRDYASFKDKMVEKIKRDGEAGMLVEDVTKEENFPIELARLRKMPVYLGIFCAATIGYGWTLQEKVSIAVPLILQVLSKFLMSYCSHAHLNLSFPVGFLLIAVANTSQTLLVDLVPTRGSSVAACVR